MSDVLQRVVHRVLAAIGRGRVSMSDDSQSVQIVQAKYSNMEVVDEQLRFAEFGFTSKLPEGTDVIALFLGGDRSNSAIIASNHSASRPTGLATGESMMFNQIGIRIYLSNAGIVIEGAGLPLTVNNTPVVTVNAATKISLNTPELDVSGKIVAGGDITDNASTNLNSMAQMRVIYDGHNHPVRNVQGGSSTITTDQPNQQE